MPWGCSGPVGSSQEGPQSLGVDPEWERVFSPRGTESWPQGQGSRFRGAFFSRGGIPVPAGGFPGPGRFFAGPRVPVPGGCPCPGRENLGPGGSRYRGRSRSLLGGSRCRGSALSPRAIPVPGGSQCRSGASQCSGVPSAGAVWGGSVPGDSRCWGVPVLGSSRCRGVPTAELTGAWRSGAVLWRL